jgi:DNA invertase Pin-like site-specific DNA recombinase
VPLVDHGLTGTNRDRPGLREAMAACRAGDVLVVTKLDRLARSLSNARDIVAEVESDLIKMIIYTQRRVVSDVGLRHAC